MDLFRAAETLMGMDDDVWMRHANPWSGFTRLASAPVLFFAVWSYVWIGWWALLPIAAAAAWTWLNPRIFPPPRSTDNWMAHGVMGERIWLNRRAVPIPRHHEIAGYVTTAVSACGMAVAVYGFVVRDFWAAFMGWHFAVVAKVWFVDRMAWLYADMQGATPEYRSWKR